MQEYSFKAINKIDGHAVEAKKYKKGPCSMCSFACKLPTQDEEIGVETEGPEFETTFSFGSNLGVDDVVDMMKSNDLCDDYGLDTISCGDAVAAYLMAHDEFRNAELVHDLLTKIAYSKDEGDLLAEGADRFHDELGVTNFSVKGMEFAAYDGPVLHGQGLSYAVANRVAVHLYSAIHCGEYEGLVPSEGVNEKAEIVIEFENRNAFGDSAIWWLFSSDAVATMVGEEELKAIFDCDFSELLNAGSKVVELERHSTTSVVSTGPMTACRTKNNS